MTDNNLKNIQNVNRYDFIIFVTVLFILSLFMVCWFGPVSEYSGHDYYFNIGRFNVLIQALKSGNYPIYIDYNTLEGYGYFTKGFYPDLIILPFAALGILTGSATAYIVMIFTMTFLCGLFMYMAVKRIFKNSFVATVSALLYTFSAYHLFDWYNRAALGESLSFTFLPIIFWGLYEIIKGDYKKWYLLTIGYSLLLYTHLLSSVLTFICLALITILNYNAFVKEPKRIVMLLVATLVTIPLTGSYLFTLLEQMSSNTFYYSINENITGQTKLYPKDLLWGMLSGILYPKTQNMAGIGPLLVLLVLLRIFVKEKSENREIADFSLLIGIFLLLFASFLFPWGRMPLGFIQFPWRLYEFIIFFFAISGAFYLSVLLKTKKQQLLAGAMVALFTLVVFVVNNNNYKYWQSLAKSEAPHWFTGVAGVENEYYLGGLEYLPVKVPSHNYIQERGAKLAVKEGYAEATSVERKEGVTKFNISPQSLIRVEVPLIYYKGYQATLNGEDIPVHESDFGLVEVETDKAGEVQVWYTGTTIQRISWYISLLSFLVLIVYIYRSKSLKKEDRNG